jgi:hypothetical protein
MWVLKEAKCISIKLLLINLQKQKQQLPWGKMLTSRPVWAINIAHFSENWGFYTMLTLLPKFMNGSWFIVDSN